jgi:hypothetical protein
MPISAIDGAGTNRLAIYTICTLIETHGQPQKKEALPWIRNGCETEY